MCYVDICFDLKHHGEYSTEIERQVFYISIHDLFPSTSFKEIQ